MRLGPFYVGQVPSEPLSFVIRDAATNERVDLSAYGGAETVFVDPTGQLVDNSNGFTSIVSPPEGVVRYNFGGQSLFHEVGRHSLQIRLMGDQQRL